MRKFTLFLAMMVAMVTSSFAQNAKIDVSKQYYLKGSTISGTNVLKGYLNLSEKINGANTNALILDNKQVLTFEEVWEGTDPYYIISAMISSGTAGEAKNYLASGSWDAQLTQTASEAERFVFETNTSGDLYAKRVNNGKYLKIDRISDTDTRLGVYTDAEFTAAASWTLEVAGGSEEPAAAAPVIQSIYPAQGEVIEGSLSEIVITYDKEIKSVSEKAIKFKLGTSAIRAFGSNATIDGCTVTIKIGDGGDLGFTTIEKEGEYTVEIPADLCTSTDGGTSEAFTYNFSIVAPAELEALEAASVDRNPLETAWEGKYKLQGAKINFNEVVKKYTTDLTGDYGYILDAEGKEVAKLDKCMGGNGTSNTFATPYSSVVITTPGTYKVVVKSGVIFSADGTKEYKGGEFEYTVEKHEPVVTPSAEDGLCWNEKFSKVADFSEFVITVEYATEITLDTEKEVELKYIVKEGFQTVGEEVVAKATVTKFEVDATTTEIKITFPEQEYAEGSYTFDVPAGLFTVDGVANDVYAGNSFTYKKPVLTITRDFDEWESYLDQVWYMPTAAMITIANAETVEVDETKVATIAVGESVYNSTLSWYYDDWSNAYYIELTFEDFFAEGFEFVKGDYTFTLPAGLYTVNGVANEEAVKTYTYGDPIVEEFSVTEILPAPGSTLESLDAIAITFSNGMTADVLPVTCGEKTYYFVSMSGVYVPVDMMSYEPIVITEPGTYTLDLSELEGLVGDKVFTWTIAEAVEPLAVIAQTPAADEEVESFSAITFEFNKDIEFIQANGGTGAGTGTGANIARTGTGTDGTGTAGNGTNGPAQFIKLKDANNGVAATYWVSAAKIEGAIVTFVAERNTVISAPGTYTFVIPAGLIKATDGEEYAGGTFTFTVIAATAIEGVETEVENDVIYDLSGRRIAEITKCGIYIVNGKKVLVK